MAAKVIPYPKTIHFEDRLLGNAALNLVDKYQRFM
jgi:hypothetical protein